MAAQDTVTQDEVVQQTEWYEVIRQNVKRSGVEGMAFQNHLYASFILMEDLAQGVLELKDGIVSGNGLSLNLETQFGQIGVRYYGFVMDGRAVLRSWPAEYKEGWMKVWARIADGENKDRTDMSDAMEDAILAVLQEEVDSWFMNAMEHQGSLSADRVEQVLYLLHPEWETKKVEKPVASPVLSDKKRRLAVTRRNRSVEQGKGKRNTRLRRKNTNPTAH